MRQVQKHAQEAIKHGRPGDGLFQCIYAAPHGAAYREKYAQNLKREFLRVPPEAWADRLSTYRFADHKERVIERLARATTVGVETLRIVEAMKGRPN